MKTKTILMLLCGFALAAPALAQSAPRPAPSGFAGLWTAWGTTNRDSLRIETDADRPVAATATPAGSPLGERGRTQAAALGERVGEVVRLGDCEEGERIARAAGDFALVQAVRDHCRRRGATPG